MAIPYSVPGYPQQTGFGAALALVPTRPLVPMAPSGAMQAPAHYHPGISPVFDPHAFLPPVKPGDFEVQSLISIPDLIRYIRKRWRIAAFIGLIFAAGVFYILGMGAKIYQSESQLLLNIKGDNPFAFEGFAGSVVSDLSAPQLVNNHRSELSSRRYMEYFATHYDQGLVKRLAERQASTLGRKDQLLKLIGLYKRKYFERRGKGNPFTNFINTHIEISVVSKERFESVVPAWSQDSRWVYLSTDMEGERTLFRIRVDAPEKRERLAEGPVMVGRESADGRYLYYSRGNDVLRKAVGPDMASAREEPVMTVSMDRCWTISGNYLYHCAADKDRWEIRLRNLESRAEETVVVAKQRPASMVPALTVSPNGHWFLYAQLDLTVSDIMSIEDFR